MMMMMNNSNRGDWNHFKITQTIPEQHESTKLSNYEKQPYWALHTNYGKCYCNSTKHISQAK